jgi:hypothetical protein
MRSTFRVSSEPPYAGNLAERIARPTTAAAEIIFALRQPMLRLFIPNS